MVKTSCMNTNCLETKTHQEVPGLEFTSVLDLAIFTQQILEPIFY